MRYRRTSSRSSNSSKMKRWPYWPLPVALLVALLIIPGCGRRRNQVVAPAGELMALQEMQQIVTVDRGDVVDALRIGGQMKVRRQVELLFEGAIAPRGDDLDRWPANAHGTPFSGCRSYRRQALLHGGI